MRAMPFQPLVRIILSVDPEQDDETDSRGRPFLVLTADLSVGEPVPGVHPEHVRDALASVLTGLPHRLAELWEMPLVAREPTRDEFVEAFADALQEFTEMMEGVAHDNNTGTGSKPVPDTGTNRTTG